MNAFLADTMVAIHVAYVGFIVLGQLAIWLGWALGWRWVRNPWFRGIHFLMMAIVVYEEINDIRCPLTEWEEHFRVLDGQERIGETFMGRLLHSLIFIKAEPWVFTAIYFSAGSAVLLTMILCPPRCCRSNSTSAAATNPSSS